MHNGLADSRAAIAVVSTQIKDKTTRRKAIEQFMADLMKQPALVTEFDPITWHTMVEGVTVYGREDVLLRFRDGAEIWSKNTLN